MHIELPNGRKIGDGQPCCVVAEIGQNHNGDVYLATRLMKEAHDAGVDAVKFCKRHIPSDLTREAYNQPYDNPNSFGPTYGKHREALELHPDEYRHLKERASYNQWPAVFFATACDIQSVDDLEEAIDPPLYKIASRDLDNLPLIDYVARLGKPVVLSTGMATYPEIAKALETVRSWHTNVIVLHCTSEYPTPSEHVNLNEMRQLRARYGVLVGLSDHTPGIVAATAAVARGACMIEKHITLSRACRGTDHAASLEPEGLRRLVKYVREVEKMKCAAAPDTSVVRAKLGRSLVTARRIQPGEVIGESVLCLKSPGDGIRWADREQIIGKVARVGIPTDVTLHPTDVVEPRELQRASQ